MGRIAPWAVLVAVAAAGCGDAGPRRVPVVGRLLIDGKPLPNMAVNFSPVGDTKGSGAIGASDADGNFTLADVRGPAGVVAGVYKVHLYPGPPPGIKPGDPADVVSKPSAGGIPGVYIDPHNTPLRVTVPDGGCTVEIDITKSGKAPTVKTTPGAPRA
jgi:hypothetical protein